MYVNNGLHYVVALTSRVITSLLRVRIVIALEIILL